jgi:hypothetical protein
MKVASTLLAGMAVGGWSLLLMENVTSKRGYHMISACFEKVAGPTMSGSCLCLYIYIYI